MPAAVNGLSGEDSSQKACYQIEYPNQREDCAMSERLVDVSGGNKTVLHTFPITLSGSDGDGMAKDTEYEEKALRAAAHAQLVPRISRT
jgi:hypothetical protein